MAKTRKVTDSSKGETATASRAKRDFSWSYLKPLLKARARTDADFRASLLKNPSAAFEHAFGFPLPKGVKLRAIEESANELFVVVPKAVTLKDADIRVVEADDWRLVINENEDCPGDGNPKP